MLVPNNNITYPEMEAGIYDARECLKEIIIKKLKAYNIPENIINKYLATINVFATPQVKDSFDSYDLFRKFTRLKVSLHDKIDYDKGLWQTKGLVSGYFENQGGLLYRKNNGSPHYFRINQNLAKYHKLIKDRNIVISEKSTLTYADVLKIINEYIDVLQHYTEVTMRLLHKQTQRVKSFTKMQVENNLLFVSYDKRKVNDPYFKQRVEIEQEFFNRYKSMLDTIDEIEIPKKSILPEKLILDSVQALGRYKQIAEEILTAPVIKGFKEVKKVM